MENSGLVCGNLDVADECWVAPDTDGVIRESTSADDLTVVRAPSEAGDLRTGINAVDTSTGGGVPEVNVAIV